MIMLKLIVWLIILTIAVIFSVHNLHAVELEYYNLSFEIKTVSVPLIVALLSSLFSGFFLASLFGMVNVIQLKNIIRKRNQTIKSLDKKIEKLTLGSSQTSGE